MADVPDDDSARQLRAEMAVIAADAQAARVLAAGADHDVAEVRAELRGHTRALNALRETQVEQGHAITELRTEMRAEFTNVRAEMRAGFATMASGMAAITTLLNQVIDSDG